jgi:hypothetical protein
MSVVWVRPTHGVRGERRGSMKASTRSTALPVAGDRAIQTYGKDRTCVVCHTPLSRYNESGRCGSHGGWGDGPGRLDEPRP